MLLGHCPAKKNNWHPRPGGGIRLDTEAAEHIQALTDLAWIEWRKLWSPHAAPLLEHPAMRITFHVRDKRSDRDNKLATLLDILQKAKILRNDNVAHCNGVLTLLPAIVDREEKAVIEFV